MPLTWNRVWTWGRKHVSAPVRAGGPRGAGMLAGSGAAHTPSRGHWPGPLMEHPGRGRWNGDMPCVRETHQHQSLRERNRTQSTPGASRAETVIGQVYRSKRCLCFFRLLKTWACWDTEGYRGGSDVSLGGVPGSGAEATGRGRQPGRARISAAAGNTGVSPHACGLHSWRLRAGRDAGGWEPVSLSRGMAGGRRRWRDGGHAGG